MADSELNTVLLALGKAQVDAMFQRQDVHAVDDSEFLPLVEVMLNAFEMAGIEKDVAEEVWEYAFAVYDRACKEAEPTWTTAENRKLMQKYLLGPRGLKRKSRRRDEEMSGKGRQTARKPATKFAHLRKKMEKTRIVSNASKKKK